MPKVKDFAGVRIYVGLSGGVDSAVAAALLRGAGAQVTGVFIKGWYPPGMPCTWAEDRRDAMRVAARLGIPFRTLDASEEYKRGVIEYLLAEYRAGRTPNPDVMCNREVKFGAFFRYAMDEGAERIATGHYARLDEEGNLRRGADLAKDQSYFLWAVPKAVLGTADFPIGRMRKNEVRAMARRFNLPVAAKPDSQGICFLGDLSIDRFLRSEFGTQPGAAVDAAGALVGRHEGALLYTLGERVALADAREAGPWYVLAKDAAANRLTVSKKRTPAPQAAPAIGLREANWLAPHGGAVTAQYRYHGPIIPGRIEGSAFVPDTPLPEPAAPGQSVVFYRDDECLGGAIIG